MKNSPLKSFVLSLVFAAVFIFAGQTINAQNAENKTCLEYEPANTTLEGELLHRSVVNASEQKETIWIVKLAAARCVAADAENEMNPAIERVSDVQLVLTAAQTRRIRALGNRKISVSGTLFAAHTQHHFTEVLLIVGEVAKK
jgi:hypothetical protein